MALTQKAQVSESHLRQKIVTETPQRISSPSARLPNTRNGTAPHNTSRHLQVLPGSRQNGGTSGSQRNHLGYPTALKTPTDVPGQHFPPKVVDNAQPPEDKCVTLRGSNAEVGHRGQCPM